MIRQALRPATSRTRVCKNGLYFLGQGNLYQPTPTINPTWGGGGQPTNALTYTLTCYSNPLKDPPKAAAALLRHPSKLHLSTHTRLSSQGRCDTLVFVCWFVSIDGMAPKAANTIAQTYCYIAIIGLLCYPFYAKISL